MASKHSGASAFPLTWPQGFPRSKAREKAQFRTTLPAAIDNVLGSIGRFGRDSEIAVDDVILSSNVTLGVQRPEDPGVALWFNWGGERYCIACDRYAWVEHNLQAIHHVIEARRTELRHGTLHLVRATFAGFKALPAPKGSHWREILKIGSKAVDGALVEKQYRKLAAEAHPDKPGGSTEAMAALNAARQTALAEIG
jgi:hypothetical protein